MARQTFEVGQRVAVKYHDFHRYSTKWYAAIVERVSEGGKEIHVHAATPKHSYIGGLELSRPTVPNRRNVIDGSSDTLALVDHDKLDQMIADRVSTLKELHAAQESHQRAAAENLERGWKRLHEALGNHTDGAIETAFNILSPLIDTDALRRYGAKEAVSA